MTQPEFPAETTPQGSADEGLQLISHDLRSWQQDMDGLLQLGALMASFSWCGHRFVIKTLSSDEELIVATLTREWQETIGGPKAYAIAVAALAVQAVDDVPMPTPVGETGAKHQWAIERFRYARRWYPPTIDSIYDHYLALEHRVKGVLDELGKASDPGEPAPPGSSSGSGPPSDAGSSGNIPSLP